MLNHTSSRQAARQQVELALKAKPDFAPARELLAELNGHGQAAHRRAAEAPRRRALPESVAAQANRSSRPRRGSPRY